MRFPLRFVTLSILIIVALQFYSPTISYAQSTATSQLVSLTCTSSPCNWGALLSGQAIVWPTALGPVTNRLGYTASAGIYLPANTASGLIISLLSGTAILYAGLPDAASHRTLATLSAGQSYLITGLTAGEVVSAQGGQVFTYTLTEPVPATATPTVMPTATAVPPTATPVPCVDPLTCNPVSSIGAFWRCNIPGCTDADWVGSVISWPAWSAFEDNARAGNQSRTVFSALGDKLYPYMGAWANGCQITAVSGTVLIIEWQRGSNVWRETYVQPGQSHTIVLTSPEDGAVIEGPPPPGFSVSLTNCNPQEIAKTPTPTPTSANLLRIGETNILGIADSGNANLLIAQQASLPQSGTIQSLSFYVSEASGQLRLGIYADAGGAPGTLMAETAAFTPVAGWNTQNVLVPVTLPAGAYWLAYLPQSNSLTFRVEGSGTARGYSYTFGTLPTTFSSAAATGVVHWSLYASFLPDSNATATPTPTTSGVLQIGEANTLDTENSGNANLLIAQQVVLPQSASIQSLSFFVAGADGQLRLGLYDDAGGRPGLLKAETAAFTPAVGWNTQPVNTPVLLPAGTYWLAFLAQSNSLRVRMQLTGSARGYVYPFSNLPNTFSPSPLSDTVHWSLYATFLPDNLLTAAAATEKSTVQLFLPLITTDRSTLPATSSDWRANWRSEQPVRELNPDCPFTCN